MALDEASSGLSEIDELAQELGAPPNSPLNDAATQLEQAFGDPTIPLPPESFRFLIGPPDPTTTPTSEGDDPEDYIAQSGRLLDQLGLVGGYGKMAAGVLNDTVLSDIFGHQKKFERPGWLVISMVATEGLSQLWRADVRLIRPETSLPQPSVTTAMDNFIQSWDPDKYRAARDSGASAPGMLGAIVQDLNEAAIGTFGLWNQVRNPANYAPFSDWENPDALDPTKVPVRAGPLAGDATHPTYVAGALAVDPKDWLEQFARVSIARRAPDRFTLSERWLSGICTEIEDLEDFAPSTRQIRIVIRPRLWKLSMRKQNRIFQDMTAIQIVKQLLKEHGIYDGVNGELDLVPPPLSLGPVGIPGEAAAMGDALGEMLGGVPFIGDTLEGAGGKISDFARKSEDAWTEKREICVQYDETDLELFERLLAEEGITYLFKSTERSDKLILADDPIYAGKKSLLVSRTALPVFGQMNLPTQITTREGAWNVQTRRKLVPSTVTLRDYNHSRPNYVTEVAAGDLLSPIAGGSSVMQTVGQVASGVADTLLAGTPGVGALQMKEQDYAGSEAAWFEYPANLTLLRKDEAPYLDPGAEYDSYDGVALAEVRRERFKLEGAQIGANSTLLTLVPGNHVSMIGGGFDVLARNPKAPVKLLVTRVTHMATNAVPPTGPGAAAVDPNDPTSAQYTQAGLLVASTQYFNTFEAQNVLLRYRPPPPARRPLIRGVQTATVLDVELMDDPDVAKDEAHVDKLWRALVRFHWDRRPFSTAAGDPVVPSPEDPTQLRLAHACWVRVGTGFAGAGFGTVFAPRVGMEVLVAFRDGNPDRPVIVGCLNNGVAGDHTFPPGRDRSGKEEGNPPPRYISDAARKTESIVRTRSLPRGEKERGNELLLVDNGGVEKIWVYAQRDLNERVRYDHLTTVREKQSNRVGGNQVEKVGKDQTLFVNRKPEAEDDFCRTKLVHGNETHTLGKGGMTKDGRHHEMTGEDSVTVDGNRTETVGTTEVVVVDGKLADGSGRAEIARHLTVGGSQEVLVTQMDLLNVSGNREITAKKALEVKAAQITMSTPGAPPTGGGEAEADPENGISMSPEGVDGHGKGRVQVYGGNDVVIRSDNDRVLIRAETVLRLSVRNHSIELDAAAGTIRIQADPDSELRVGTPAAFVSLSKTEAKIEGSGSSLVTTADTDANAVMTGATVQLEFEGEIHMNAPSVEYQRSM
ncbi:MAG: hypothetical protein IT379_38510 [Deltaproteobacteria bacterium]|nr:hypothetical protein [Deltaproteobacteria bacterium]